MDSQEVEKPKLDFKYTSPDGSVWGEQEKIAEEKPEKTSWQSLKGFFSEKYVPPTGLEPLVYSPDKNNPQEQIKIEENSIIFRIHFSPPEGTSGKINPDGIEGFIKESEYKESEEFLRKTPGIIRNGALQMLDFIEKMENQKNDFEFIVGTTNKQMGEFAQRVLGFHQAAYANSKFIPSDLQIVVIKRGELIAKKDEVRRYARI